ncbi:lytic transglycosylase domain-containing protein [Paenibacillus humicola]|uniref:lytic transglycosylase domain-containing protein n=1 Tax=Paenibacillus humicola TaxID=3110540 RepID=UPI00237BA16D|nr:lytic transglycosylase domain-containing protein [Paenibacillus humicola]
MSIDPRILSSLLRLQFMPSYNLTGTTADAETFDTAESGDPFGYLLQQLIAGGTGSLDGLESSGSVGGLTVAQMPELGLLAPLAARGMAMPSGYAEETGADTADFEDIIQEAAAKYRVEPSLIKAVIDNESSFHPEAVSAAGAKGLMQLMDGTARSLGVTDSFDPRQNIDAGTRYLSYLIGKYSGSIPTALAAYNAGPGRVDRAGIRTGDDLNAKFSALPEETRRYVASVMDARARFGSSM